MNLRPLHHILCADDDADMRMILEVALGTLGGWRVTLAADGEEAIAAARTDRPDLILLDASMAGVGGAQTLATLRADPSLAAIPVVFVTGLATDADRASFQRFGAIDLIAKPFDPLTLAARVRAIWQALPG
ncbi:response regulator [Silanimonas sp.]|uniref:response regulator n=1 Tax=Silanimonas sp. TaxID=1929290 RepID=UPI0022C21F26|nr:response regulator [Silanimonas sp.]MCZ8115665.1 response regulator [Silanimonas sp.]